METRIYYSLVMNELSRIIKWKYKSDIDESYIYNTARKTKAVWKRWEGVFTSVKSYADDLKLLYPRRRLLFRKEYYYEGYTIDTRSWDSPYRSRYDADNRFSALKKICKKLGIKSGRIKKKELLARLIFYEKYGIPFHYSYDKILGR